MRLALGLLLANYLGFALFLVLRPSSAEYLRAKDEALTEESSRSVTPIRPASSPAVRSTTGSPGMEEKAWV